MLSAKTVLLTTSTYIIVSAVYLIEVQVCWNQGVAAATQTFAKVNLLSIDNDNEQKKVAKNINHFKFLKN